MDNASKALIMAGAILIAVAIVGIGIYIFSASNSLTEGAVDQIDAIAVQMFNNTFYQYAGNGETISGTRATQLYDAVTANAAQGVRFADGSTSKDNIKAINKYLVQYTTSAAGYVSTVMISQSGS